MRKRRTDPPGWTSPLTSLCPFGSVDLFGMPPGKATRRFQPSGTTLAAGPNSRHNEGRGDVRLRGKSLNIYFGNIDMTVKRKPNGSMKRSNPPLVISNIKTVIRFDNEPSGVQIMAELFDSIYDCQHFSFNWSIVRLSG